MLFRRVLSEAERAAVSAEGAEFAAEIDGRPLITEPEHRLTDLPIGAIALVVSGAAQARRVIAESLPEAHAPEDVTAAVFKLIGTFGVGSVPTPHNGGEA